MLNIIIKSILFSFIVLLTTNFLYSYIHPANYLADVGGLSAFASLFGSLYGIMTAFVVFEVWSQHNKISHLVGQEALGLERLYRLTLNFKDEKLSKNIKRAILDYGNLIIKGNFKSLGEGGRNPKTSEAFRKIVNEIRKINIKNGFDQVIFDHLVNNYELLSQTRTERVDQSVARIPRILKTFLYLTSLFVIIIAIFMPFANIYYSLLTVGMLTFTVSMVLMLVDDLDNPFKGYWNITTEPFIRALKHIEEDYNS